MTPAPFVLTSALFAILSGFVEERIGLHYDLRDADIFAEKLRARAVDAGFDSPLDYYYHLRYDDASGAEFQALAEALVVHETYFFRDLDPLRVVAAQILAPAVRAGRRPRVWCAACSTGEEPLSLAMLLDDAGVLDGVEIVASDLSSAAVARCRSGVYGGRSLRAIADEPLARYLDVVDKQATVAGRILSAVDFRRLNLLDADAVAALGAFDVIVCRNVFIYFSDATVVAVVGNLLRALSPDGRLVVGAAESLLRFGSFVATEEVAGAFLYRRSAP